MCPVRRPCLAYALRTRPAAGVWAGFTPEEITGLIAAAARPARVRRTTALRPAASGCPQRCAGGVMTALDSRSWACGGCGAVCIGAVPPGQAVPGLRGAPPAARPAAAVLRCPAAEACESCGAARDLWVLEADTPVGVICLTLCGPCADAERTPRLSCPAAVGRAMAHEQHAGAGAGVAW